MSNLRVSEVSKNYGGLAALNGVSMEISVGERRAIIGPNGAGKTTLLAIISGEMNPTAGAIYLGGKDITVLPSHVRANLGLGYTFQRSNLFASLTVLENVSLAVQHHCGISGHVFQSSSSFESVTASAVSTLQLVGLASVQNQLASYLAHGQQRALEVALALATNKETEDMVSLIAALPRTLTILIVEHDMGVVFRLAERITVMQYGQVISEGSPDEVRADPEVRANYLGSVFEESL